MVIDNYSQLGVSSSTGVGARALSSFRLRRGDVFLIVSLDDSMQSEVGVRLRELGFQEREMIICRKKTPFGGPWIFEVGGAVFSLDADLTNLIYVIKQNL